MLSLDIRPIFAIKAIEKPYSFLVKNGFTSHSAHNLLNVNTRVFRLDHIELLCQILICTPNDLLFWKPTTGSSIATNHPLYDLNTDKTANIDLKDTLLNLPYQQLKEISSKLTSDINRK